MVRIFSILAIVLSMAVGFQYEKEKYVRSNTTSACPLYNMYVYENYECGPAFDAENNPRDRYCGYVKVFRYTGGDKATLCYYEGYVGTYKFDSVTKKNAIILKFKNKMW